ncbi:hypothetical protein MUCCIDRAFT_110978 [Mucor lusitanicus CBS 277.49]|uniref:Uncharacterized protein n=1 Tax=Mucor lusitanicus CBS 277.49 TaxID=747725 RepID=A0A162RCB8_MUCCL|nr:hypothetical protein MUCCIDRAFT_110978 [Mucor lusitanicus CBS 277.49]
MRQQKPRLRKKQADSSGSGGGGIGQAQHKDRFIDLAQAALEEANLEEERKGVIHEVMEALIAKSGAPLVAEVISEQLRSQDVIERIAEHHEEDRRRINSSPHMTRVDSTDSVNSLKAPDDEELEQEDEQSNQKAGDDRPDTWVLFAEYLWRFFRVLLLASLVGLMHFSSNLPSPPVNMKVLLPIQLHPSSAIIRLTLLMLQTKVDGNQDKDMSWRAHENVSGA